MSTHRRYHAQIRWEQDRCEDIRAEARMLTRLLGVENRHSEWRDASWQRPPRGRNRRGEPRRFYDQRSRRFRKTPEPMPWPPYFLRNPRRGSNRQQPRRDSPATGEPGSCRGEASLWRLFECLLGTGQRNGKEAASWGNTPRPSVRRPRKVSQGTTDAVPGNLAA